MANSISAMQLLSTQICSLIAGPLLLGEKMEGTKSSLHRISMVIVIDALDLHPLSAVAFTV
jgi:hypothetical protein